MKKIVILIAVLIFTFIGMQIYVLTKPVVLAAAGTTFELKSGTSKYQVLAELHRQKIISKPFLYLMFVLPQNSAKLKAGEYFFAKDASFLTIWRQLRTGRGQIFHPFMIIPGWTFAQVREALNAATWMKHSVTNATDAEIMARLGKKELNPEGEFYPETYYFTKGVSDVLVLKRAFNLMQKKLQKLWETRSANLPYRSAYDALIAASLVEKEAYLSSERPVIAGVLVNRLRANMLLQFDPTIIYGLGKNYAGKIYKEDLTRDTPYNTYIHKGLPPTPIAMPSFSSLKAALNPTQHDYYYFVAKGDGAHQFSKSLVEHNQAVKLNFKPRAFFNTEKIYQQIYLHWIAQRQLVPTTQLRFLL